MAFINLRKLYPWYLQDEIIEISDAAADVFKKDICRENAYLRMMYRYNAHYSIDRDDGIELEADHRNAPQNVLIEKLNKQQLYAAITALPVKQAKRLYAYFYLEMSLREIAKSEGVTEQGVGQSVMSAIKNLRKYLIMNQK